MSTSGDGLSKSRGAVTTPSVLERCASSRFAPSTSSEIGMKLRESRPALVLTVTFLVSACGGGTVADGTGPVLPPRDTVPTGGPPTVQRSALDVQVIFDPADATLANTAGVSVEGMSVRLTRSVPGAVPRTVLSGASGRARFDSLLEGNYQISVERSLTAGELQRLPSIDRETALFAGGIDVVVRPPTNASAELSVVGTRRGSVVISEIFAFNGLPGSAYGLGTYAEVYNNADTTAYLDGMLIFWTQSSLHRGSTSLACESVNVAQRLDTTAIYSSSVMFQFPGSGREFPIRPGEAKVLAMDALDHQTATSAGGQVDLSKADFEQIGTEADINNPFVPDMIRVFAGTGFFGRGFHYMAAPVSHVLALPAAKSAVRAEQLRLTNAGGMGGSIDVYRVPREFVLDVFGVQFKPGTSDVGGGDPAPLCTPWLAPTFDRSPAFLIETSLRKAIGRRSVGRTADGREILQRTRTSARDLELRDPLTRSLLKP